MYACMYECMYVCTYVYGSIITVHLNTHTIYIYNNIYIINIYIFRQVGLKQARTVYYASVYIYIM